MITFKTNGRKECTTTLAEVNFGTCAPSDNHIFRFHWEAKDPHYAYLLAQHFQEELEKRIRQAHRDAYEQGYKDGRGRKRKKTDFIITFGGHDHEPAY